MKYDYEPEEEFLERQREARRHGQVVFRNDANREMILDIIDMYLDLREMIYVAKQEEAKKCS